jgi:hypothetical protein
MNDTAQVQSPQAPALVARADFPDGAVARFFYTEAKGLPVLVVNVDGHPCQTSFTSEEARRGFLLNSIDACWALDAHTRLLDACWGFDTLAS